MEPRWVLIFLGILFCLCFVTHAQGTSLSHSSHSSPLSCPVFSSLLLFVFLPFTLVLWLLSSSLCWCVCLLLHLVFLSFFIECVDACDLPLHYCTYVDYPISPFNLNVTANEHAAARIHLSLNCYHLHCTVLSLVTTWHEIEILDQVNGVPFPDCKLALQRFACGRVYPLYLPAVFSPHLSLMSACHLSSSLLPLLFVSLPLITLTSPSPKIYDDTFLRYPLCRNDTAPTTEFRPCMGM